MAQEHGQCLPDRAQLALERQLLPLAFSADLRSFRRTKLRLRGTRRAAVHDALALRGRRACCGELCRLRASLSADRDDPDDRACGRAGTPSYRFAAPTGATRSGTRIETRGGATAHLLAGRFSHRGRGRGGRRVNINRRRGAERLVAGNLVERATSAQPASHRRARGSRARRLVRADLAERERLSQAALCGGRKVCTRRICHLCARHPCRRQPLPRSGAGNG